MKYLQFSFYLITLILLILCQSRMLGQEFNHIKSIGSMGQDIPIRLYVLENKDVMLYANNTATPDLDSIVDYGGKQDFYLARFTQQGNRVWSNHFIGPDLNGGLDMLVDNEQNIYVTGFYRDSLFIGNDTILYNPTQDYQTVMCKYNESGRLEWVFTFLEGRAFIYDLKYKDDQIYFCGVFTDSLSTRAGNKIIGNGSSDVMFGTISSEGQLLTLESFGGDFIDSANSLLIDDDNNIILWTQLGHMVDVYGDVISIADTTRTNRVLVKLSPQNEVIWIKEIHTPDFQDHNAFGMVVDDQGNLYCSSFLRDSVQIESTWHVWDDEQFQSYIISLDRNGSFRWIQSTSGGVRTNRMHDLHIYKDELIAAGSYSEGARWLGEILITKDKEQDLSGFLTSLSFEGEKNYTIQLQSDLNSELIALSSSGEEVYFAGTHFGEVVIGDTSLLHNSPAGFNDLFIFSLSFDQKTTSHFTASSQPGNVWYQNSTHSIRLGSSENYQDRSYFIYNPLGQIYQQGQLKGDRVHIEFEEKGIFYFTIRNSRHYATATIYIPE